MIANVFAKQHVCLALSDVMDNISQAVQYSSVKLDLCLQLTDHVRIIMLSWYRNVSTPQFAPELASHRMDHSGHVSNEDRLFMSCPRSYPGQGSFTLTVQGGQVRSVRPNISGPQHLTQVDQLANSMINMEIQVNICSRICLLLTKIFFVQEETIRDSRQQILTLMNQTQH